MSCSSSKDSVFVETIPSDLKDDDYRYDRDNKVYLIGREFLYKFSFSKNDTILKSDVEHIRLEVQGTTEPFSRFSPDYDQTVIEYSYLDKNSNVLSQEKTGVIENDRNIWLHPPRSQEAGILQLSAFPYIKFDRKKWNWDLEAAYSNYKAEVYRHTYSKSKSHLYQSELGPLLCETIFAETESSNGKTSSRFLYNKDYGFILLEFLNIDGTKITLALTQ
jgi:hypothetical protein